MKNKAQLDGMPVWFDGKSINEALFCEEFLQTHIDEEQGQYLDPLVQIPQLFVKVGFDGAPDLRLLDDVLVHVSNGLAQLDLLGIAKLDMFKIGSAVNSGNGVAFVQFPPAGQQE